MSFSRAHYLRVSPPADAAEQVAERLRDRAIREQAHREMCGRWPELSPENFREAMEFFWRRVAELRAGGAQ